MRRIETWVATTLFAFGIILGMVYLSVSTGSADVASKSNAAEFRSSDQKQDGENNDDGFEERRFRKQVILKDEKYSEMDSEVIESGSLSRGDRYLIGGNYALALDYYSEYSQSAVAGQSAFLIRQAICLEKQQEFERAAKKYFRAINNRANDSHQLIATAGFARCLLKNGDRKKALDVLSAVVLKLDGYPGVPSEVVALIVYEYSRTLEAYAVPARPGLIEPKGVAFEDFTIQPEELLSMVDGGIQQQTPELEETAEVDPEENAVKRFPVGRGIVILQKPSSALSTISVGASTGLTPILSLITQLTSAAELQLVVSQQASSVLQRHSRAIELRTQPMSSVLDQLISPYDLAWYQLDSVVHVVTHSELAEEKLVTQFWVDAALRGMRLFEISYPDNDRRHSSLLSKANLNLIQERYQAASNLYQELMQSNPKDEVLAKLFFNQGKLQILMENPQDAVRLLYLATDQSLDPDVQSSSYSLLGKIELSFGSLQSSIQSSRRGVATAINNEQRQYAALNLARAYLLAGDPFSANNAIFKQQQRIVDPNDKAMASIIGSFARFNGTSDQYGIEVARNRLLRSVAAVKDEQFVSFADCYFAANAYRQLGFDGKAMEKLKLALQKPDIGQWNQQVLFELAILLNKKGKTAEAIVSFQSLVGKDEKWSLLALERLASIYSETGQTDLCIEACKQLWQANLNEAQKRSALEMLGGAFQQKGEHHAAALCFSGMLPNSF
ncbi:MAG: hypothetical protein AB8B55_00050 [Mariniblastus sp.]